MPADYDKIRAENITRYGTDTAVLDLLGQLYSDRTHFIFELIQNAEDAGARELAFELLDDRLEVRHDGRPFTEADVRGICGVGNSAKSGDLTAIGRFGIGFKSVYAYTQTPSVHSPGQHSPGEHFRIENYVRPVAIAPQPGSDDNQGGAADSAHNGARNSAPGDRHGRGQGQTLFIFPFDRDDLLPAAATAEIAAALTGLELETLLFLRNIERITVGGSQVPTAVLERTVAPDGTSTAKDTAAEDTADAAAEDTRTADGSGAAAAENAGPHRAAARRRVRLRRSSDRAREWLVWHRDVGGAGQAGQIGAAEQPGQPGAAEQPGQSGQRVEIAFPVRAGIAGPRLAQCRESPLVVFFPTQKETFLGFLIQGPYRTTPARDNVPEHDPANQFLVRETAVLLTAVLADLRDTRLLTADVLQALPLDAARFGPGTMFRALFDSVREALASERLIPAGDGAPGYGYATELTLARGAGLRDLLSADQLAALDQAGRRRVVAHESITDDGTPALWRYLRTEIGVAEITPQSFVASLTGEFLAQQPDAWMRRLYAFLHQHLALWRAPDYPGEEAGPARSKPIIRLEDGSQVAPFDADGRPAAYLPGPGPAGSPGPAGPGLPTVRRAIARFADARHFLAALQLGEPDVVTEVLATILPRYTGLEAAQLDSAQHEDDLERVARALAEAPPGRLQQLRQQVSETAFLVGENAATGEQRLLRPASLYQRTPGLESYFAGNPDAWFARDGYGPWLPQLREMGVRDTVAVQARNPGTDGHVMLADGFARRERGLHGFDPAAAIDGLEFALSHPSHRRSEYIWNLLLGPNRDLLAGVIERSVRLEFADASREDAKSAAGLAATAAAWLPGPDGAFHRPAELQLDDLPPEFRRDDILAAALDMIQPAVAEASRQLGLPPGLLRGLSAHPDLVAMVERELQARAASAGTGGPEMRGDHRIRI